MTPHLNTATLADRLPEVLAAAPIDHGTVELIVARPAQGQRSIVDIAQLNLQLGLVGDNWAQRPSIRTPDRSPHPDMQLTLMHAGVATLIAGDPARRALAGDQLYLDLDLSEANLPAGTCLAINGAVIQITAQPHTGCAKFAQRFGLEALQFVNSPEGKPLRLRGANARIVRPGTIRTGATVRKTESYAESHRTT